MVNPLCTVSPSGLGVNECPCDSCADGRADRRAKDEAMMRAANLDSLARTIDGMARDLRNEADRLTKFADGLREVTSDESLGHLGNNVTDLLVRLLNNSNQTGHIAYAISEAHSIARKGY